MHPGGGGEVLVVGLLRPICLPGPRTGACRLCCRSIALLFEAESIEPDHGCRSNALDQLQGIAG